MLDLLKRYQIQVLRDAGHTQQDGGDGLRAKRASRRG